MEFSQNNKDRAIGAGIVAGVALVGYGLFRAYKALTSDSKKEAPSKQQSESPKSEKPAEESKKE